MSIVFTESQAKKQELNCGMSITPVMKYLEDLYGHNRMQEIVESVGLPLKFLNNRNNWIAYDYYIALLEKMVEVTHDENAPYKAPFSMKPQSMFEELFYATYATIFSGSPLAFYKLILNPQFYRRFTKIGDFELLKSNNNSLTMKLTLNKKFKQHKYNCLALQGYYSSLTLAFGLSPSTVEHTHCAAKGADSCIYIIKWQEQKRRILLFSIISTIIIIGLEVFLLKFPINDIILTVSLIANLYLIFNFFQSLKKIRDNELFNYQRNNTILEALKKIENDYNELLKTDLKLENNNKFLTIINEIRKLNNEAFYFTPILFSITKILLDELNFYKGAYFQFNYSENIFESIFEMNNEKYDGGASPNINFINKKFSIQDYRKLEKFGEVLTIEELQKFIHFDSQELVEWSQFDKQLVVYFIPIEIPDVYIGFYILLADINLNLSKDLITPLFENISGQLKIGYQKISSRYVIENILSSIPSYVLIFNIENLEIRYVNNMFLLSFPGIINKYSKDEIVGVNLFKILPVNDEVKNKIIKDLSILSTQKAVELNEINIGPVVIEYSLFMISQYKETERMAGIIMNDITEAKYFQQNLLINEKLMALGRVASGIAHEINNPLYAVLANAEEIADDKTSNPETRQYAEEIVDHVMNVSKIIKDLSSYSKTLRKEEFDEVNLNDVIEESLKLVKYSLNFLEVDVINKLTELPTIKATKGEMQQIFINLINNAIHAMNGKGVLELTSAYEKKNILISIKDSGCGISEENQKHIFDLFFTTKKPGEGTGQGLHIVKKIIDTYNGSIKVESKIGAGTTFYISFNLEK